ncbi:hypothetical protein J2808_003840 [Pseudarthrobacter sulfonivorans]|jgi:hypothetical protein|nr:hypothetical protein [Pseudarthrobacter sulfonivorans]
MKHILPDAANSAKMRGGVALRITNTGLPVRPQVRTG